MRHFPGGRAATRRERSRLRRRCVGSAVIVTALVLPSCGREGARSTPIDHVQIGTVAETVRVPAQLEAGRVLPVATPAPGTVVELFVRNGDQVEAGQPVLRVDSPLVQQLAAQSLQGFGSTKAACDALGRTARRTPSAPLGGSLGGIQGAFDEVFASLERARDSLRGALPDPPALPDLPDLPTPNLDRVRGEVEGIRLAIDQAAAELSAGADAARRAANAALGQVSASITAMQTSLLEAQQSAGEALRALACGQGDPSRGAMLADIQGRLLVRAPAGGTVVLGAPADSGSPLSGLGGGELPLGDLASLFSSSSSSPRLFVGSEVGLGQTLFSVYDMSSFIAVSNFDEGQVIQLEQNAPASVRVESLDRSIEAELAFISPVRTGGGEQPQFRGEITLTPEQPHDLDRLVVGMTAQVDVRLRSVGPATVVPESAILRDGDKTFVYIVENGRARARDVKVLGSDGMRSAVRAKGLKAGVQVILAPRTVDDGVRVASSAR